MTADGVIVFRTQRGNGGGLDDATALEHVEISVRTTDGDAISGSLEALEDASGAVFRPEQPLPDGAELEIVISADNDAIDDQIDCDLPDVEAPYVVTLVEGSMADLQVEGLEVEASDAIDPSFTYDSFVCCDGAYPTDIEDSCGGAMPHWSEGYCAPSKGTGFAVASLPLPDDEDPRLANIVVRLVSADGASVALASQDGTLELRRAEAFEAHYEVLNLATDEILMSDSVMIGAESQLGEIELDPTADLQANCSEQAYTCETVELDAVYEGWDPEQCTPYGDSGETDSDGPTSDSDGPTSQSGGEQDGSDSGCGCTAASSPRNGLAFAGLFLGLVALRRRFR
jgi:MYXO-CTERM domain-containing protein